MGGQKFSAPWGMLSNKSLTLFCDLPNNLGGKAHLIT